MKIIFLDIDGVLNSINTLITRDMIKRSGYDAMSIDDTMVEKLANIVHSTGALIVLTSTWKLGFEFKDGQVSANDKDAQDLLNIFNNYGITIYDKTCCDSFARRNIEIYNWISNHAEEIDSFVIIDDKNINNETLKPYFVKTNFSGYDDLGLCDEHVQKAINILNNNLTNKLVR